mgnify:CR=1 FL=1
MGMRGERVNNSMGPRESCWRHPFIEWWVDVRVNSKGDLRMAAQLRVAPLLSVRLNNALCLPSGSERKQALQVLGTPWETECTQLRTLGSELNGDLIRPYTGNPQRHKHFGCLLALAACVKLRNFLTHFLKRFPISQKADMKQSLKPTQRV